MPEQTTKCKVKCVSWCNYVQPPKGVSFKPIVFYKPPVVPMDCRTIQKQSFMDIDPFTAANSRQGYIRPKPNLGKSLDPLDVGTVMKLSYPGHFGIPIIPPIRPLRTQLAKGDFDDNTTSKLSYMYPSAHNRAVSCKPVSLYRPPQGKLDDNTIHKMSFQPVRCKKALPVLPKPAMTIDPNINMDLNTCYKLSYPGVFKPEKLNPIRPSRETFMRYDGTPFDDDTIQKLSFKPPGHFERQMICCEKECTDSDEDEE